MPKQNRTFVRDGRIQAKKKRTDRSYLRPAGEPAPELEADAESPEEESPEEQPAPVAASATAGPSPAGPSPAGPSPANTPVARQPYVPARVSGTQRALQQQGVRKRRDVDVTTMAERDTRYALHELRRIATLTVLVLATLIVLAIVLR